MKLSDRQTATLAAAVTVLSAVVIVAAVAGLAWLLAAFVGRFSSVFLPLAVAGVIALVLKPYFDWLVTRWRFPPPVALAAVFVSVLIPFVAFGWFFGDLIFKQLGDLLSKVPGWWQWAVEQVQLRLPRLMELWEKYDVGERLRAGLEGKGADILGGLQVVGVKALSAGAGIFGALGSLLGWVVVPVYIAFFLLIDPKSFNTWSDAALPFFKAETRKDVSYLVDEFVEIIVAFFRGQLLIAFLQGLLFGIGFQLVGLSNGFVIGLALGFLNIVPYLGSMIGMAVALPLSYFQQGGGLGTVAAVLVVFAVVQTIESYVLTPKIMGEQTGLHPMVIMVAIFFWGSALNGIAGMILAIPLTAFFVVFWRLARESYIKELV